MEELTSSMAQLMVSVNTKQDVWGEETPERTPTGRQRPAITVREIIVTSTDWGILSYSPTLSVSLSLPHPLPSSLCFSLIHMHSHPSQYTEVLLVMIVSILLLPPLRLFPLLPLLSWFHWSCSGVRRHSTGDVFATTFTAKGSKVTNGLRTLCQLSQRCATT